MTPQERAEALAGPHQPWRTQGGDYTCPALLLGKNPCSCGQAQRVEGILALLEAVATLRGETSVLVDCPCHCHEFSEYEPHLDCRECVRGTATPTQIDHDHEWALWCDKWKEALDLMGKQAERAEAAEAKVRELEAEVQNQIALKVGLAGQLAVALTSDGRYDEGRKAGLEEGAKGIEAMKNGCSVEVTTGVLENDPDGPWFLKSEIAKAIRALAGENK